MNRPLTMPPIYLHVLRLARVGPDHLFVGGPHRDRITLEVPDGRISTEAGLTVATSTTHSAGAPLTEPGWYDRALTVDLHKGRKSLCNFGFTAVAFRRPDGVLVEGEFRGLNTHTWRGDSNGCHTVPEWWMSAALAALHRHGIRRGVGAIGLLIEAST